MLTYAVCQWLKKGKRTCPHCRVAIPSHEKPNRVRVCDTIIGDSSPFSFCFTARLSLVLLYYSRVSTQEIHRRFIARMLVLLALLSVGNFCRSCPYKGDVGQGWTRRGIHQELEQEREHEQCKEDERESDSEETAYRV